MRQIEKAMHVSPFMGMDQRYHGAHHARARRCRSTSRTAAAGDARVRRDAVAAPPRADRGSLARMTARYPLATLRVLALIYAHALGLKLAGAAVHPHPKAVRHDRTLVPLDRVVACCARIRVGSLIIVEDGERHTFGSGPRATVSTALPAGLAMLLRGSRGLAEAYAQGLWDSPDLVALIRLARAERGAPRPRSRARLAPVRCRASASRGSAAPATRGARSRRDIAAHYDLGNELFERMLDPTMSYSCALFERHGMTLEQAQVAKLERDLREARAGPEDRVLEIGSGWGAFALHAASDPRLPRHHDDDLARAARPRASRGSGAPGWTSRVTVLMEDYRELRGRYDKLVSIEMIEAVGWRQFGTFFAQAARELLAATARCCCRRSRSTTAPTRSRRQRSRS